MMSAKPIEKDVQPSELQPRAPNEDDKLSASETALVEDDFAEKLLSLRGSVSRDIDLEW